MDLGRGADPKSYMVDEIWQELAKAKYLQWEHASTKRSWELQSLKYVIPLSLGICFWGKDYPFYIFWWRIVPSVYFCFIQFFPLFCREACEIALREKHFLDDSQPEGFLDEASISNMKQLEALGQVFREAGEADIPGEVRICVLFIVYILFLFSIRHAILYSCGDMIDNFRCQITCVVKSHLIFSVILSLLQVELHMRERWSLIIFRRWHVL